MIELRVNGEVRRYAGDPGTPLLWYLRDELELTGTKFGCGLALCGSCTVHLNGMAVRACITPVAQAQGGDITTIEGLHPEGEHPLQQAWREEAVPQCGFCQAGQIMQAASLLARNKKPSDAEIDADMSGNLCRCGTYQRIRSAIRRAAEANS